MYSNYEPQSPEKPKRRPVRLVKQWTHSPKPHSSNDTMKSDQKKKLVLVKKNISFAEIVAVSKPHTEKVEPESMTLYEKEDTVQLEGHVIKRTIMTLDEIEGKVVMVLIVMA